VTNRVTSTTVLTSGHPSIKLVRVSKNTMRPTTGEIDFLFSKNREKKFGAFFGPEVEPINKSLELKKMQKIVNVLAVASSVVSLAVVGSGLYVFVNRASLIDGVKSQVMEAVTGALPSVVGGAIPDMTGPAVPSKNAPAAPKAGLGIPK